MAGRFNSCVVTMQLVGTFILLCIVYGSQAETIVSATKKDVKYIKCGVCEELVKQLSRQVKKKMDTIAPKKLTELEIIDLTENICNLKKEEAEWLMYLDIVEDGDKLKLVEQQEEGECNSECKTLERACQQVMGDHDTDIAEFIFKGEIGGSALSKLLCKDLSGACVSKPPAVPKDRAPGERFTPKPTKDAEMAKLMRSMSDMPGAPGMQMYSRDQLLNDGMGVDEDDDEDENENEENDDNDNDYRKVQERSNPTLGRELVQSGLLDQAALAIEKLKSDAQKAFVSVTFHVNAFGHWFSNWWSGNEDPRRDGSSGTPQNSEL